ncbi:MAG TPA: hypothetical protein VMF03_20670 [Steroidobacteraceae bacterium]|nr:hypothetical protein [Steroidobacteraceae bacterium]
MRLRMLARMVCFAGALALSIGAAADTPAAASSSAPVPIRRIEDTNQTGGGPEEPKYGVDASWVIAGYNDDEVIYSIIITNRDPRIIRCSTVLSGFYLENGTRHSVSDRQGVTIFPGKQSSAGRWVGMDQAAGATYKVTCRAVS